MNDTGLLRQPEIRRAGYDSSTADALQRIWETRPGLLGWLSSVDHKEIGKRYLLMAFLFLLMGGVEALMMRTQLAGPNRTLLTPEQYNQLFTMHGVTMIFLYALPVLSGFSNFLWPLMLGSRDMAFPRLNALSYWIFLAAGIFLYSSFPMGAAPNAGWFNYVPYSGKTYNPGPNTVNLVTSAGSFLFAFGVLLFLVNVAWSLRRGTKAPANPWDAGTLEWSMPSPPPYNFVVIPEIASRHPLWESRLREGKGHSTLEQGMLLDHGRETVGTSALDAEPDVILRMPGDSLAPFLLTLASTAFFVGLLLHSWRLAGSALFFSGVAVIVWLWPEAGLLQTEKGHHA